MREEQTTDFVESIRPLFRKRAVKIYVITTSKIRNVRDVLVYQDTILRLLENIGVDITRKRGDIKNTLSVYTPTAFVF